MLNPAAVSKLSTADWVEVVRVASGRVLGRTPRKVSDPEVQLASLASRVTHGAGRVRLPDDLATQAGWLVADRLGLATGTMPAFGPAESSSREKWRTLVDVRHAAGVVMDGVSHGLGVDLTQSPISRHELVNERSYLGVYETRQGAMWRLETTGRGAHHGIVYEGTADSLAEGKDATRDALRERFPEVARSIEVAGESRVVGASLAWMPIPGARDERTLQRVASGRCESGGHDRWERSTRRHGRRAVLLA